MGAPTQKGEMMNIGKVAEAMIAYNRFIMNNKSKELIQKALTEVILGSDDPIPVIESLIESEFVHMNERAFRLNSVLEEFDKIRERTEEIQSEGAAILARIGNEI